MKRGAKKQAASQSAPASPLDAHLGYWLRAVSNQVSGRFRQSVEDCGVSVSEWVALRSLYGIASATPLSLMQALGMTKGAISKIIGRLEAKGLAHRSTDAADKRAQHIALTPAGRALVPRLAALADANDAYFFGVLSEEARATLSQTLRHLVQVHGLTQVPTE